MNHRLRKGCARNNLKSGKNCRKRGNIDLSTFENYLKMLEDETSIRSRREICCFFELLNNSSIQTTRPFFEIVINIAFVNFLSTIPRRRPPVSSLASNRRKKMLVALEAGLRHPKHNICLNNISKLACSFERLQHFRHESLSLFDLILEITVDEEGSIVELASKENGGRTHESLVKLFEDLEGRWRMKSTTKEYSKRSLRHLRTFSIPQTRELKRNSSSLLFIFSPMFKYYEIFLKRRGAC